MAQIIYTYQVCGIIELCYRTLNITIITVHDLSTEDLFVHFENVFHFIEHGKQQGGVLVHW